ncbi:MAG: hypothetical protein KJZ73_14915 [Pseudorhodoplanes sp.]|nr:hypothetical protein [Pseudorhodoplanes sp.]
MNRLTGSWNFGARPPVPDFRQGENLAMPIEHPVNREQPHCPPNGQLWSVFASAIMTLLTIAAGLQ